MHDAKKRGKERRGDVSSVGIKCDNHSALYKFRLD